MGKIADIIVGVSLAVYLGGNAIALNTKSEIRNIPYRDERAKVYEIRKTLERHSGFEMARIMESEDSRSVEMRTLTNQYFDLTSDKNIADAINLAEEKAKVIDYALSTSILSLIPGVIFGYFTTPMQNWTKRRREAFERERKKINFGFN